MNITGRWKGIYTFSNGYPVEIIGRSEPFQLDIIDKGGVLSGVCIDNVVEAVIGNESYILGTFKGNKIIFKKRYKIHTAIDEKGTLIIDDRITSDGIDYAGKLRKKFFSGKIYFSGKWSIISHFKDQTNQPQTHICEGTWKMFRVE